MIILKEIVSRRQQLVGILVAERNRLGAAHNRMVKEGIQLHIDWLKRQLDDTDGELQRQIETALSGKRKTIC